MSYANAGWLSGLAIAIAIDIAVPSLGFAGAALLGFGLPLLGLLLGKAAGR